MKKTLCLPILTVFALNLFSQIPVESLYLGQTPPGKTATIFAPDIISLTSRNEHALTISPDQSEYFFTVSTAGWATAKVMYLNYTNGSWISPVNASFTDVYELGAMFTPDGNRLLVASGKGMVEGNICVSTKTENGWSPLVKLSAPINSTTSEWEATITNDSTMIFSSARNGAQGLYYSELENGAYVTAKKLPSAINQINTAHDVPYVAPDGSYLIFGRGAAASRNLFISYRTENGWTNAQNLGDRVNTNYLEAYPSVSPDSMYLFFTREIGGNNDIYWVYIKDVIDSLKHANFTPYLLNQIPNQNDTAQKQFSYTVPDSIFFDDDGMQTLSYTASLADGKPLPSWMQFNAESRTFSAVLGSAGTFKLRVIATDNALASVEAKFTLKVNESPNSIRQNTVHQIQIFPNPTTDKIQIALGDNSVKKYRLQIASIDGKLMLSQTIENKPSVELDLATFSKGIYILSLIVDNKTINTKLIKE